MKYRHAWQLHLLVSNNISGTWTRVWQNLLDFQSLLSRVIKLCSDAFDIGWKGVWNNWLWSRTLSFCLSLSLSLLSLFRSTLSSSVSVLDCSVTQWKSGQIDNLTSVLIGHCEPSAGFDRRFTPPHPSSTTYGRMDWRGVKEENRGDRWVLLHVTPHTLQEV